MQKPFPTFRAWRNITAREHLADCHAQGATDITLAECLPNFDGDAYWAALLDHVKVGGKISRAACRSLNPCALRYCHQLNPDCIPPFTNFHTGKQLPRSIRNS